MSDSLPVTAIVVTKQEAKRLADCLAALRDFGEILVYNSGEDDVSREIAKEYGARFEVFFWNGVYPKKRQYCLDHIPLVYDWVFFVDADEIVTPELVEAIRAVFPDQSPEEAGFFVTGRYEVKGRVMRFGMPNRKIALFHKKRMMFPVVDDLDLSGMGEIEGHYQPVCVRPDGRRIGDLSSYLLHRAYEDERAWAFRHEKYARWESGMTHKGHGRLILFLGGNL